MMKPLHLYNVRLQGAAPAIAILLASATTQQIAKKAFPEGFGHIFAKRGGPLER
jgi:hypothetical protein